MNNKIKIIKIIDNNVKPKKQLYNDILSSSSKIKEIIKQSKSKKNYLFNDPSKINIKNNLNFNIIENGTKNETTIPQKKKTLVNHSIFFKYEDKKINKKTIKKFIEPTNKEKSKKTYFKETNILNYFNNKKKIKLFTKNEIKKFIKVLNSKKSEIKFINKYIKKLNKYQTIQILYALKIITKKSNAPIKILKNILLNYFLSNIVIIK